MSRDYGSVLYTVGVWTVKAGHEQAFIQAWQAMAQWTTSVFVQAHGRLLRDRDQPGRFISFGPWPDEATIAAWRASPEFAAHIGTLREHLDEFAPATCELVSEVGA